MFTAIHNRALLLSIEVYWTGIGHYANPFAKYPLASPADALSLPFSASGRLSKAGAPARHILTHQCLRYLG